MRLTVHVKLLRYALCALIFALIGTHFTVNILLFIA